MRTSLSLAFLTLLTVAAHSQEKLQYFDVTGLKPGEFVDMHHSPPRSSPTSEKLVHDEKGLESDRCVWVDGDTIISDPKEEPTGLPRVCLVETRDRRAGWVEDRFLTPGEKLPPPPSTDISHYPVDVLATIKPNLEYCKVFYLDDDFARNDADLNGDGINDWIIDWGSVVCDGSHTAWSGSLGSSTQVLISTKPNKWKVRFDQYVQDLKVVTQKGKTVLSIGLHGSACGKKGTFECSKIVSFHKR